ncbi:MAG: class I SAM-dependent methyltransferase [Verrucomicrobiota bacterium]
MFHPKGPTFWEQARQCFSSTKVGYDMLAPKFEYTPYRTPDWMLDEVAKVLARENFDSALDVCCGTGAGMRMLRPLAKERVVGIDFSDGMLDEARQLLKDEESDAELKFEKGDILQELNYDAEFDVATCFGALGHIVGNDTAPFLQRVRKTLKPGGRFVFLTCHKPPPSTIAFWFCHAFNFAMHVRNLLIRPKFIMFYFTFLLPEIQTMLEENGFEVEVVATDELKQYRVVVARRLPDG